MQSNKDDTSKIEVVGRLLTKELKGKGVTNLSEEVSACILNLTSKGFHYSLLLTNNDVTKKSTWQQLSFEIKPSMQLSKFINQDVECYQWFTNKNVYFLELLIDEINSKNKDNFEKILEQCLCSLDKNIAVDRAAIQLKKSSKKYIKYLSKIKDLGSHVNKMEKKLEEQNEQELLEEKLTKEMKKLQLTPPKIDSVINIEVAKKLFSAQGELFNYNTDTEELVNLNSNAKTLLTVYLLDSSKYEYVLCTETLNGLLVSIDKINDEINGQVIESKNIMYVWISKNCYTEVKSDCLGFLFDKKEDIKELNKLLKKCNYESKMEQPYEKIEEENRAMLERASNYENIKETFSSDEEDEDEKEEKKPKKKSGKKNRKVIMDIEDDYKEIESEKEKMNKFCIDSLTKDRTFCITSDNQIVVYKAGAEDDSIEKLASLPVIQEYKGKNVCFSHGQLFKSENNILLLDENNPYVVYQYDLPHEKIVSEWQTETTPIEDICSQKKNAQITDDNLIYGVNGKAVFTMDDRLNNKNVIANIKEYSTRNYANKIMSNNDGQFVTGSKKGDIRLYDKIGIKAKNLFSFYGDPIRAIDISADDKYLLLTCDKYLLLVNTEKQDDKSAFLKTVKTVERKTPIILQIKTTDIAKYKLADSNYTSAKFNTNKNGENNILSSLGEYVVIWNYNDIRKGKLQSYKIKKVGDLVIDNHFKAGGNKIILALPTKVRIHNQKKIFG